MYNVRISDHAFATDIFTSCFSSAFTDKTILQKLTSAKIILLFSQTLLGKSKLTSEPSPPRSPP